MGLVRFCGRPDSLASRPTRSRSANTSGRFIRSNCPSSASRFARYRRRGTFEQQVPTEQVNQLCLEGFLLQSTGLLRSVRLGRYNALSRPAGKA